jgi:SAM-dependent methyltransferase
LKGVGTAILDEEIQQKIASFPRWHYRFDLRGYPTPIYEPSWVNRHEQRKKYFFEPLVQLFGGSLAGKRVLDIGCNAGFWSLAAAQAGCDYVLGVDGRQMHVDQANFVFEVEGIEKDRYDFIESDFFAMDVREFGRFDIVLCLGLMYHVSKHMNLMEKISEVNDDVLLIDTALAKLPGPYFAVRRGDRLDEPRSAVDHELVMVPTWEAVRELVSEFQYESVVLKPRFESYEGSKDYRKRRRAFLCAKQTDISRLSAEIEHRSPFATEKRAEHHTDWRDNGSMTETKKFEGLMRRMDLALSELFASRRWKLTRFLGAAQQRLLRNGGGPTAEDRLLATGKELRASLERLKGGDPSRKRNKRSGKPEGP